MSLPYFFIENIVDTKQITLSEETSRHCIQVLRMQQGEALMLTDGKGSLLQATITDPDRKQCLVSITDKQHKPQPGKKICVAISLLKNAGRFEWLLEKITEIGVTEIIPLISKRTEKQYFRFDRSNNIIIAAMLQSGQAWLPLLHEPQQFEKTVAETNYTTRLIAHCEEEKKADILNTKTSNDIQILIGPEGDFTNDEILFAKQQNFLPVTLGSTRLRTETAAVVAAALLKNKS
jgi:16S rRNA (uracil1498-N3)-methyltransferase